MADPLILRFDVETNRARQGMADLAGSIATNMASVAASMTGGAANTNKMGGALENLVGHARRAGLAIGTDILKVANDTGAAATKVDANLQNVVGAFTRAAVSSNTAGAAMRTSFTAGSTALATTLQQVPLLGQAVEFFLAYKFAILGVGTAFALFEVAARTAAEQIQKLQDISKGSREAGVSSDFFQVMTRQLETIGLTAKEAEATVVKARAALTERTDDLGRTQELPIMRTLDELRSGRGIAREAYNLFREALPDDIEARFKAVVVAIKEIGQAARETGDYRLNTIGNQFAESLGLAPAKAKEFADKIRDGKVDLEALTREAVNAGAIFDASLVARSKELDDKIAEIHRKLEDDMRPIMRDLAAVALDFKDAWSGSLGLIDSALGSLGRAYQTLKEMVGLSPDVRRAMLGGLETGMPSAAEFAAAGVTSTSEANRAEITRRANALGIPNFGGEGGTGGPDRYPGAPLPPRRPPPSAFEGRTTEPREGAAATDEVETYINQLTKAVAVLRAEAEAYGKSNTAKAAAVDLAKAEEAARVRGTPLTEAEKNQVLALADAEGRLKDQAEKRQKAQEAANAQAAFFGDQMISVLDKIREGGHRATDILKDLTNALVKAIEQAAILGTGPFAGLFGMQGANGNPGGLMGALVMGGRGLFTGGSYSASDYAAASAAALPGAYGPGYAEGGLVKGGGGPFFIPSAVLARARHFDSGGGIPAIVHPGEIILNQAQQGRVAAGLGGGTNITVINNHPGAQISTREVSDGQGGRKPQIVIDEMVATALQSPKTVGAMRSVYRTPSAVARR